MAAHPSGQWVTFSILSEKTEADKPIMPGRTRQQHTALALYITQNQARSRVHSARISLLLLEERLELIVVNVDITAIRKE